MDSHKVSFSTLILVFLFISLQAQPPQKMSYQAVVRDAGNQLVTNQSIGVRISILLNSANGPTVYAERHQTVTNGNGLMTLEIGMGSAFPGYIFADIDWGNGDYYLQSNIDLTGGSQYTLSGTQQLITVPYAFFAESSADAFSGSYEDLTDRPTGSNTGDLLYWNVADSSWHIVNAGSEGQVLMMGPNGIPQWNSSNLVNNNPPTVSTDSISAYTGTTAYINATIVNQGTTGIIESGVCWSSTNPFPSIGNNHTTDGSGIGSYVSYITGLTPNTTYYIRAFATNSIGTAYGAPLSFTTPTNCGVVTDWDGNIYNTTYIGNQCWMKENLKVTHYSNGVSIVKGTYANSVEYTTNANYYFVYNDDNSNISKFGLLYTWYAMMNGAGSSSNNPSGVQGVCPNGWHLPSHAEWCQLENYLEPGIDGTCSTTGYRGSMAKTMATPNYWSSYPANMLAPGYWQTDTSNFNNSGFSAIPGGVITSYYDNYNYRASSSGQNSDANFWSCTATGTYSAYYRSIGYSNPGSYSSSYYRSYALSVRCLKN